jgi:hypothetical protein
MPRPNWFPIPYYYSGPLAKLPLINPVLPHKPGYVPPYSQVGNIGSNARAIRLRNSNDIGNKVALVFKAS